MDDKFSFDSLTRKDDEIKDEGKKEEIKPEIKPEMKKPEKVMETKQPEKKTVPVSDKISVRAYMSVSEVVRGYNPYLKAGFERWLGNHYPNTLIERKTIAGWDELYNKYALFAI